MVPCDTASGYVLIDVYSTVMSGLDSCPYFSDADCGNAALNNDIGTMHTTSTIHPFVAVSRLMQSTSEGLNVIATAFHTIVEYRMPGKVVKIRIRSFT